MTDKEVIEAIEKSLEGSTFRLIKFERDHEAFGNMVVQINSESKKYRFTTDRDDIWCNHDLIIPHGYHIAGQDDAPIYLLKAIKLVIGN